MQKRVAVVTGASGTIGGAVVRDLLKRGIKVWGIASSDCSDVIQRKDYIMEKCDVADYNRVEGTVYRIIDTDKGIDILVNAAGINRRMRFEEFNEVTIRAIIDVNLIGTIFTCQAVGRFMLKRGYGRIINVSSAGANYALGDRAIYEASKAGVERITKSLAFEWAARGVSVNGVAPGLVESAMTMSSGSLSLEQRIQDIPMKRCGTADEIAKVICYVALDAPEYMTGAIIHVDGGRVT